MLLIIVALLLVTGAYVLGYETANNKNKTQLATSVTKAKTDQANADRQEANSNIARLYICLLHAQAENQRSSCYREALDDLLPPLTIKDFNDLPDVR